MVFSIGFKALFSFLTTLALVHAEDGRIIGGQRIFIKSAPYIVQLRYGNEQFCGGTLVTTRHVVTAAHCLLGLDVGSITVVGGASLVSERGFQRRVIMHRVPKEYTNDVKHMDIAVLKLDSELRGPDIKPIPLCSKPLKKGDILQVSGWGKIAENGPYPNYLSTVFVPTISREECKKIHAGVAIITDSMVCGSVPGEKDACTADSGGPAVNNGELCGVVSWGIGCGRKEYPGVYTDIVAVRSFLNDALKM